LDCSISMACANLLFRLSISESTWKTELESEDANSWVCKSDNGVQALFWNYTAPDTTRVIKVLQARHTCKDLAGPDFACTTSPGNYRLNVYRVGHNVNDVYADYLKAGSPLNLTREQVQVLAEKNDGRAVVSTPIRISAASPCDTS
jgi:xylan 1,4-beta-xylosidase